MRAVDPGEETVDEPYLTGVDRFFEGNGPVGIFDIQVNGVDSEPVVREAVESKAGETTVVALLAAALLAGHRTT